VSPPSAGRLEQIEPNLRRRARVIAGIREFFTGEGFLEVETPVLMPYIASEQFTIPFEGPGWYLSTSPEIYMKQLIAAGYGNLFQLCHAFRREEKGQFHQPEFTMLEWYRLHTDYLGIVRDTENLCNSLATRLGVAGPLPYQGRFIDLTPPWPQLTVSEAFRRHAGWDPLESPDGERMDHDLVDKVMPAMPPGRPLVLLDYPAEAGAMARLKPGDRRAAERAEIFIGGMEIANIYSELTDAGEQEQRLRQEVHRLEHEEGRHRELPEAFLAAVKRLPECGGVALGVDRLVMLFCDAASIEEVVSFPWEPRRST
jgi:elongation factor P--(R)-beta-lysine ligase